MCIHTFSALHAGHDSVRYYEITLENIDSRSVCNPQDTYSTQVDKVCCGSAWSSVHTLIC